MTNHLAKKLCSLVQLDIDAVKAYEQALNNIDDINIHAAISKFRDDHNRHIVELSGVITQLGEKAPDYSVDIKGFFIQGFTAIRSLTGTEGALKAMLSNEKLTTSTYAEAMEWDVAPEIKGIIERNYADEQRHLAYIQDVLKSKLWVKSA